MRRIIKISLSDLLNCFRLSVFLIILVSEQALAEGRSSKNDSELKSLFNKLLISETASSAEKITLKIWKIWTNDSLSLIHI